MIQILSLECGVVGRVSPPLQLRNAGTMGGWNTDLA